MVRISYADAVTIRAEFSKETRRRLGDRVGYRCSCPKCRRLTVGPTKDIGRPLLIGEAAHITAASQGGPRFDANLSTEDRKLVQNGIWLCATCHEMVDKDHDYFTDELLRAWKVEAEDLARREVEGEVIFNGYIEPKEAADKHFNLQFEGYAELRRKVGATAAGLTVPVAWLQAVTAPSLKRLVNFTPAQAKDHLRQIQPVVARSWVPEVSRFGVHVAGCSQSDAGGQWLTSLVQLFQDGSLIAGFVLFEHAAPDEFRFPYVAEKVVPWIPFEDRLIALIGQARTILANAGLPMLAFLRLTLTGTQGFGVVCSPSFPIYHNRSETDVIRTPTVSADLSRPETVTAKPLLDGFWQHLGVWHSPSYSEGGEFIRRPNQG